MYVTKILPLVICHCEIRNYFFLLFLNAARNTLQNLLNSNYIGLNKKTAFGNDFGPGKVPQPENA
jgi:hypothetical protein